MSKNVAYEEYINQLLAQPPSTFSPFAEYDSDGDCIEFFAKSDPYYAERIDTLLTVYRSQETKEIVGSMIQGVTHLCKELFSKYPNLRIEIHEGKIRLVHIFRAKMWLLPSENQELVHIYKILADAADESRTEVDAPACGAAA